MPSQGGGSCTSVPLRRDAASSGLSIDSHGAAGPWGCTRSWRCQSHQHTARGCSAGSDPDQPGPAPGGRSSSELPGSAEVEGSEQSGPFPGCSGPSQILAADSRLLAPVRLMAVTAHGPASAFCSVSCSSLPLKQTVAGFTTTRFYFFKTEIVFSSNCLVLMALFPFLVLLHYPKPEAKGCRIEQPPSPALLSHGRPRTGAAGWSWEIT